MATLVSFHAHPDDEAITCAGTMLKAARAGHRVVLVYGTRGEHGEVEDGFLQPDEQLWERREKETQAAADILGVERVEFLGYVDSGMIGTTENEAAESFWQADVDEAAERLATILRDENADVLTIYDDNGGYGHPDHIKVHRVGLRAAELAGTPRVYEAAFASEEIEAQFARLADFGIAPPVDLEETPMGVPGETITHRLDVTDVLDEKRAAMAAHASQIPPTSFFLAIPDELFADFFGIEEYRLVRGDNNGDPSTIL